MSVKLHCRGKLDHCESKYFSEGIRSRFGDDTEIKQKEVAELLRGAHWSSAGNVGKCYFEYIKDAEDEVG